MAAPSATFLSVFVRQYKKEDVLVSQGVFFGHLISLVTIPVFLSLYFMRVVLK
jgi:predicted permease